MGKSKKKDTAPAGTSFDLRNAMVALVAAAANPQVGFLWMTDADVANYPAEMVIVNTGMRQNDKVPVKPTDAGVAFVNGGATAGVQEQSGPKPQAKFTVMTVDGFKLPEPKRGFGEGGGRKSVYKFEDLQPNQVIVVEATAEMPDPARSLASTVSSASRRFSTEIPGTFTTRKQKQEDGTVKEIQSLARSYERKFEIRAVEDLGALGQAFAAYAGKKGAVIARVK